MPRNVKAGKRVDKRHQVQRVNRCKKCGCTHNDACHHPDHGECYWVNPACDLCSHCQAGLDCGPRDSQIAAEMEAANG